MNKHEAITCGIFYCRDSAEINGCGSLQTSSWLDSDVLRIRQQKHTAIRYEQLIHKTKYYGKSNFGNGEQIQRN